MISFNLKRIKSPFWLFVGLFLFRLSNALSITTLLFPDEWWQFGEVAHKVVYGSGYLTWDWRAGIRSYLFPLPLILLLKMAKTTRIGEEWIVRNGCRLVMAGWMALTDFYTVKLAGKLFGPDLQPYAVNYETIN